MLLTLIPAPESAKIFSLFFPSRFYSLWGKKHTPVDANSFNFVSKRLLAFFRLLLVCACKHLIAFHFGRRSVFAREKHLLFNRATVLFGPRGVR